MVEARVPADGQPTVTLRWARWTPGFYRVEDYAGEVEEVAAQGPAGETLRLRRDPEHHNRWTIETAGAALVTVKYRLRAERVSVTKNWVGPELDYSETLAWFGLRFAPAGPGETTPEAAWRLEVDPSAGADQVGHLRALLEAQPGDLPGSRPGSFCCRQTRTSTVPDRRTIASWRTNLSRSPPSSSSTKRSSCPKCANWCGRR